MANIPNQNDIALRLLAIAQAMQPNISVSNGQIVFTSPQGNTVRRVLTPTTVTISRSVRSR